MKTPNTSFFVPMALIVAFIFAIVCLSCAIEDDEKNLDKDNASPEDDIKLRQPQQDHGDDDDDASDDDDDDHFYEPPNGIEFVFYDIGQGDAALVRFPHGSTMLMDGGPNQSGDHVILPHFDEIHLDYLDYMVVTHPDSDHCGGLDDVVEGVDVGVLWENGQTKTTETWNEFSQAVDEADIPRIVVDRGYQTTVDDCMVKVINADQGWSDVNANSIVISIACEGVSALFTGDITEDAQDDLIIVYSNDLASELIKVPHHGSPDRAPEFPTYVVPEVAVISCGANNPYGHPDPNVIAEWEAVGAEVFRTDFDGTITVTAKDGILSY